MECCVSDDERAPAECPRCATPGRLVERITVKALLRPEALARLSAVQHRFCASPGCPVVYFGRDEMFSREELSVAVFQKEPVGARTVCYCFDVTEAGIRREIVEARRSSAFVRITDLVNADRCACEVKNPQGRCCLGNVAEVTKRIEADVQGERRMAIHD